MYGIVCNPQELCQVFLALLCRYMIWEIHKKMEVISFRKIHMSPEKGPIWIGKYIFPTIHFQGDISRIFRGMMSQKSVKKKNWPNLGLQKFLPFWINEKSFRKKKSPRMNPRKTTSRRWSNWVHWMWSWNSWSFSANLGGSSAAVAWTVAMKGEVTDWEQYCWWKKSQTTTWDVRNPVNNLRFTDINWCAGFLPSTVWNNHRGNPSYARFRNHWDPTFSKFG